MSLVSSKGPENVVRNREIRRHPNPQTCTEEAQVYSAPSHETIDETFVLLPSGGRFRVDTDMGSSRVTEFCPPRWNPDCKAHFTSGDAQLNQGSVMLTKILSGSLHSPRSPRLEQLIRADGSTTLTYHPEQRSTRHDQSDAYSVSADPQGRVYSSTFPPARGTKFNWR